MGASPLYSLYFIATYSKVYTQETLDYTLVRSFSFFVGTHTHNFWHRPYYHSYKVNLEYVRAEHFVFDLVIT
jgi:hypothetical protein